MARAFPLGDRPANRERAAHTVFAQPADMAQERLGAARAIGADQQRCAVAVRVGDLRQRLIQHGDVIGGGVRAGVARPQQPSQELPGVVQERHDRVEAEDCA